MKSLCIAVGASLALLLASCGNTAQNDAVPRRYAYPRVEAIDTLTQTRKVEGFDITLSRSAQLSSQRPDWLTARYPSLGATLHLTVMRFKTRTGLDEALANRRQRISLNLGGATAITEKFENGHGFAIEKVSAPEGVATPVQFIATDASNALVNGVFTIDGGIAPVDSLRPVVEQIEAEAERIIKSLGR